MTNVIPFSKLTRNEKKESALKHSKSVLTIKKQPSLIKESEAKKLKSPKNSPNKSKSPEGSLSIDKSKPSIKAAKDEVKKRRLSVATKLKS